MKRFYCILLTFIITISFNNTLFPQIINGSFEEWDTVPFLNPTGWATGNFFVLSVTQSNDAIDGNYSAKMEITDFAGERFEPTLQNLGFQNQVDARYKILNLYYKSDLKNFARLDVIVTTWDSSAATQQLFPSGGADTTIRTSAAGWTFLELPINYFSTEDIPAYANIVFAVSDSAESTDLSSVGSYVLIDNVSLDQPTDVSNIDQVPVRFNLSQNYPNPFNPSTSIEYRIPKSTQVTLSLYDILGNRIAELVNENQPAGNYMYKFDGSDLSSGTYFIKLNSGEFSAVRKILLLK